MQRKGLLIDMDGVIYRENQLIPGAADFVSYLTQTGTPFVFVTNNSAPTPEDLVVKMRHLGIEGLGSRHFYTSAMNTADFLSEVHPGCTAYVIGEAGLNSALQERKIPNDSMHPSYVVVGEGNPSGEKLFKAHELIEKGARLIATNPDNWCPVKSDKTRPGAGATAAFLEASTGQRAYYLGKPNPHMFVQARKRLYRTVPEVLMVGDTMETDIRGAIEIGLQACLVLTGSTKMSDLGNYVYQPTCVMESVAELLAELKGEQGSSRLGSPTFTSRETGFPRSGDRHQTDRAVFQRPRPAMTK